MAAEVWRIRDRSTFAELRRHGRRGRAGSVSVTWLPAPVGPPRLACAINRQVGGAVVRNRTRRRVRAIFADLSETLPAGAYLVRASPSVATIDHRALEQHVRTAIEHAVAAPERS
ncbi:MAG: ribonuclease P protein component [Acidobacteria bacterium]|nr:ribonuclease P protein component [Acidobacteriota bacterium]